MSNQLIPPLPLRDGIAPSRVYLPYESWDTVYEFLQHRFPHLQAGVLRARLIAGDIVNTQGQKQTVSTPYRPGQWLWYYREVVNESVIPFSVPVLFQDELLVVVDKPHFLATTPGGRYLKETVLTRLRQSLSLPELSPIHRLDRDTAGVLVFCVQPGKRGAYQSLFQRQEVHKVYEAIALQKPASCFPLVYSSRIVAGQKFLMQEAVGVVNSQTRISMVRLLEQDRALYRLEPLTGRKHQLRVHLSALGMPIINDDMYPCLKKQRAADDFSSPLQLLARSIAFLDPVTGRPRFFESQRNLLLDKLR